jgi:serine/threonine protein phosphatase PrpC
MWRILRLAKQLLIIGKHYAGQRIQGQRHHQEDDFSFDNSHTNDFLMVIADGLGGHQGGAYASHCAVQTFIDSYYAVSGTVSQRLQHALHQANHQLAIEAEAKELYGMGCTLVGVVLKADHLEWISVGDSPLWLYDKAGHLHRLNADHSIRPLLLEQVQRGLLTVAEAAVHPDRNMLFSALTGDSIDLIDQSPEPLQLFPGDHLLLASDGIFTLSDEELGKVLKQELSAKELVDELLSAVEAKDRRDQDNTTVLVVKIPDEIIRRRKLGLLGFLGF